MRERIERQNQHPGLGSTPFDAPEIDSDMNVAQDFEKLDRLEQMIAEKRKKVEEERRPKALIEGYEDGLENFDFHANQYDEQG